MANKKQQKLELTWIGKGEEPALEPRILIENPEYSYGDPNTENLLIHGDNLLALKALEQDYTGKIKCIYIDPPYNTGQAFEHYDDGLEHSIWLDLMSQRFRLLRNLLTNDGTLFVQLDDNEVAYCRVILDEIFGRENFLNQVSAKMKQTSGASGGGEDKKLKKNIEYLLIYSKDKNHFQSFNPLYDETNLFDLIKEMRDQGKSWKYTRVIYSGLEEREYFGETKDGSGDIIKIFKHNNIVFKTIKELMKQDDLTEEECYVKYHDKVFRDTNAQSSIRTRVMEATEGNGDFFSIDYIPKSGKNKNKLTTLYYKGNNCDLIAWLSDVCIKKGKSLVKLEKAGTYWDGFPLNNLTKEGGVKFPHGKKPEALIQKVLSLATQKGDFVLDSFLGSGTTAAAAMKMGRKFIGVELGDHALTHCVPRFKKVIKNKDTAGITKAVNWEGGGGFKFYELAPSLLNKDKYDNWVISKEYNADMLAAAMAKQEGFRYAPDKDNYWKQGYSAEQDFIFTTTQFVTVELLDQLQDQLQEGESLLICAKKFQPECHNKFKNIVLKKIPKMLLGKCEFGKDDYSLNIINPPVLTDEELADGE
ncbi:site-specific DNA-methyltransferase [Formosa maritima]|uniref:site-specific DNA-methyltransferase (adenine-specific) n=1 Tax=Formosa maritima TaxID=2592046 RepID=A0A5D0G583_9FLAO|nr:site-specific DNA-methyltransferase [Formosa maritima]TYA53047.1 site-specific DNA-methyltransferase [Formosa maritima]